MCAKSPKVSVIVPVYNVSEFLVRCLDSIINQTLKDIEIICVNDGSKDNSLEILKKYSNKDNRIKIIDKENEGLSCARNEGIKIAKGEYISFIDSDDWVDLNFLELLYNTAKKYDADISLCGIKRIRKYTTHDMLVFDKEYVCEELNEKINTCNIPETCYVWNKIYKTSELRKNNLYFEPYKYYEDRCFSVNALIALRKIVTVPNVFYYYFKNKNSIVQKKSKMAEKDSIDTYDRMLKILEKNHIKIFNKVKKYRVFGITIFKVKYNKNYNSLVLFNFIKMNIRHKNRK